MQVLLFFPSPVLFSFFWYFGCCFVFFFLFEFFHIEIKTTFTYGLLLIFRFHKIQVGLFRPSARSKKSAPYPILQALWNHRRRSTSDSTDRTEARRHHTHGRSRARTLALCIGSASSSIPPVLFLAPSVCTDATRYTFASFILSVIHRTQSSRRPTENRRNEHKANA